MYRAQVVVMKEKVYMGGGNTSNDRDAYRNFLNNKTEDKWSNFIAW